MRIPQDVVDEYSKPTDRYSLFMGIPIETMTREELLIVVAWLSRDQEQRQARDAERVQVLASFGQWRNAQT